MPNEHQVPGFVLGTLVAGADLSAKQFYAVKVNSSKKLVLSGAGEEMAGILQNNPVADVPCAAMVDGVSKAVTGAVVAAGAALMADANGKLITATTGNLILGRALGDSGGDLEVIAMLLKPEGVAP